MNNQEQDKKCVCYCHSGDIPREYEHIDHSYCKPFIALSTQHYIPMTQNIEEKLKEITEKFAELEHIRWAKWQNYLHSFLTWNNDIQAWVLPHEKKDHWQTQINTPYAMLSEKEKESDREQVRPYIKEFIKTHNNALQEAEEKEKVLVLNPSWNDDEPSWLCVLYRGQSVLIEQRYTRKELGNAFYEATQTYASGVMTEHQTQIGAEFLLRRAIKAIKDKQL